LDRSAVILGGGSSSRFGEDKGVLKLADKPLLNHVIETVRSIVGEVIVVTSSKKRADLYAEMVSAIVQFVVDVSEAKGPLVGALTGFEAAQGEYSLLLPFDFPFVSRDVLSLLCELCIGKSAVIPRWPNNQIEPLHAVYQTKQAAEAAKKALRNKEIEMSAMIRELRGVRYIFTLVIEQLDPDLRTFFNINTPRDLGKAITILRSKTKAH
jgi:molybdopterin-guanine dinucleotide biosynthesis protein A